MMTRLFAKFIVAALILVGSVASSVAAPPPPGSFMALCYHNVEDNDPDQNYDGVTTTKLIEQLSWLKHEGYTAVSIDDVIAARDGKKTAS